MNTSMPFMWNQWILESICLFLCINQKVWWVLYLSINNFLLSYRPQHLTGLNLINDICHGKLEGGRVGSAEIKFYPGPIQSGEYLGDIGTAG